MENKVIATFTDYHGAEFIIKKRTIMQNLEGKKTYISLIVAVLGIIGVGDILGEAEVTGIIDTVIAIIGIIGAIYGRYDASRRYRASIK